MPPPRTSTKSSTSGTPPRTPKGPVQISDTHRQHSHTHATLSLHHSPTSGGPYHEELQEFDSLPAADAICTAESDYNLQREFETARTLPQDHYSPPWEVRDLDTHHTITTHPVGVRR